MLATEAFRVHSILVNHAKQKRKGTVYVSPGKKMEAKLKKEKMTLYVQMVLCNPCTKPKQTSYGNLARCIYKTYPRKSMSMEDMETQPMDIDAFIPEFNLEHLWLVLI